MAVRVVEKKSWPEYYRSIKSGKRKSEVRLADFTIASGDKLVIKEFNPKTRLYTGKKLEKKVRAATKLDLAGFYSWEDVKKHGVYLVEF